MTAGKFKKNKAALPHRELENHCCPWKCVWSTFTEREAWPPEAVSDSENLLLPATFLASDASFSPGQVFLRESLEQKLEKQREEEVTRAAMVIRAHILGYLAR